MKTAFSLTAEIPNPDPDYRAKDAQPQESDSLTVSIEEQVKKGLFLYAPDEFVNIRVLLDNDRMTSQFSRNTNKLARFVAGIDIDPEIKAIYVQLQVLDPERLNDVPEGKGVKRHHVSRYRWFVIDIDTLRPNKAKTNATEEEKQASLVTLDVIRLYLRESGWPEPAFCDSGNGWHLVWRVDLPNIPEDNELLHLCLVALAAKFNNQSAEIDTSLADPEQIIKLWGTMTRKGENTATRPWRRSGVVSLPNECQVVSLELLRALAAQAPAQSATKKKRGNKYPSVHEDFEPEDFFEWCQENLPEEYKEFLCRDSDADRNDADGHHYVMDGCFWAERKHSGDRRKTEFILGETFGFSCFSGDCDDVSIGDILRKMTKLTGKPYPGQIFVEDESVFEGVEFLDGNEKDESVEGEEEEPEIASPEDQLQAASTAPQSANSPAAGDPLAFPEQALYGKLGEMATAMKMPLGLGYPAAIGVYSTVPDVDEMNDTRINNYVILLAPPGGGKNQAIKRALALVGLPKEHYKKSAPVSDRGVMQLVGHRVERKRGGEEKVTRGPRKLLLVTNEAANVLKKANIKNSSLGATLSELWDENEYAPADRSGEHGCNCRLSWIGGLPIKREHPEEFGEYFGRETGRGLLSRTILGFSDVKFNYREWKAPRVWSDDENGCMAEMAFQNPKEVHIVPESRALLEKLTDLDEEEEGRLKYIAKKVALLTAAANGDKTVGVECMNAAIEFAKWQGRLREVFKIGVAAENSLEAQFTEALLGALKQKGGEQKHIAWRRLVHDRKWEERFGPRVVNTTVKALVESGTLEIYTYIVKDENQRNVVKENPNKVRLRTWKVQAEVEQGSSRVERRA